jgi:hypothetical protein
MVAWIPRIELFIAHEALSRKSKFKAMQGTCTACHKWDFLYSSDIQKLYKLTSFPIDDFAGELRL